MTLIANTTYTWTLEYTAPGISGWKPANGGYVTGTGSSEQDAFDKVFHLLAGDKRLDARTLQVRNFRLTR